MKIKPEVALISAFFLYAVSTLAPTAGLADINRGVTTAYPARLFAQPDHAEFLPMYSNRDPHPHDGDGQDWDTTQWNEWWTPENAVKRLFGARVFERQYMRGGQMPVVELGPNFYNLSDIDQGRTLKLLADYSHVFKQGYGMIELEDWLTHEYIGAYTPRGLYLK
jgi:hypothetical protein